jgi:hypothetical protein
MLIADTCYLLFIYFFGSPPKRLYLDHYLALAVPRLCGGVHSIH